MDATILRSEVLKQMDTGLPFKMEVVSADRKRGTGGELLVLDGWCKIVKEINHSEHKEHSAVPSVPAVVSSRNPNHRTHKTLNVHNPNNPRQHPISIHWLLIQFFNGKRVIN